MKHASLSAFTALAVLCLSASLAHATVIANWTFETSQPAGAPGAATAFPSVSPEVGSGSGTGFHTNAATYSTPAGNGSAHSFSANVWGTVGDYWQFSAPDTTDTTYQISWDQISSTTGPKNFKLQYSIDGSSFTDVSGGAYVVLPNTGATIWSSSTPISGSSYSYTVTTPSAPAANIYFRMAMVDQVAANSGSTFNGTTGTDRVDNVVINTVPEPATFVLGGLGLLSVAGFAFRRKMV